MRARALVMAGGRSVGRVRGQQALRWLGLAACLGLCAAQAPRSASAAESLKLARKYYLKQSEGQTTPFRPLESVRLDPSTKLIRSEAAPEESELLPDDAAKALFARAPLPARDWNDRIYAWAAPEFWHQPLYFEQLPLERYGQSAHPLVQPWLSGAHFFGSLPVIPYRMGLDHPFDCVPSLGYYRPGSCPPPVRRRFVWSRNAALWEAAAWIGPVFGLP